MRNHVDVSEYAHRLTAARLKEYSPTAELDMMATFFAAASTRMSKHLTSPLRFGVRLFNMKQRVDE
jgi:hypothetical protein